MLKPRPAIEEAQILTRRTMAYAIATDFIASQKEYTNLTKSEKRGLRKLTKRVKAGEIVVIKSDKSGKLCICSMEAYMAMGGGWHVQNLESQGTESNVNHSQLIYPNRPQTCWTMRPRQNKTPVRSPQDHEW